MSSTAGNAENGGTRASTEINQVAEQRRQELRSLHHRADAAAGPVDQDLVDRLFALTDDVLALEERARAARLQEEHRLSSRKIYAALAVPIITAPVVFVIGHRLELTSGWDVVALLVILITAAALAVAHRATAPTGHQERIRYALGAAGAGTAAAILSLGSRPWWVAAIVWIVLAGFVAAFTQTLASAGPHRPATVNDPADG